MNSSGGVTPLGHGGYFHNQNYADNPLGHGGYFHYQNYADNPRAPTP